MGRSGAVGHTERRGEYGVYHLLLICRFQCWGDAILTALWHPCKGDHEYHAGDYSLAFQTRSPKMLTRAHMQALISCHPLYAYHAHP